MTPDTTDVQQSKPENLEPVADLTPRRRKELAREMEGELGERAVRAHSELVQHPTNCWLAPTYRHSRGRNSRRHCSFAQHATLMLDRAAALEPEEAARRLLTQKAEFSAMVNIILDRVVGLGEGEVGLQHAFEFEAREGSEEDVATVEALADEELTVEELRRIEDTATSAKAALQMKIRAVQRERMRRERRSA